MDNLQAFHIIFYCKVKLPWICDKTVKGSCKACSILGEQIIGTHKHTTCNIGLRDGGILNQEFII